MESTLNDILMHYGMPRRSGRYPWGSGKNPYQHGSADFISEVERLRREGFTYTDPATGEVFTGDKAIYKNWGMTSSDFRRELSISNEARKALRRDKAQSMRDDGKTYQEIADALGLPGESSVRALLNYKIDIQKSQAKATAEIIKKQIDEKGMIDVGAGVERELNVSKEMLETALYILQQEGYPVYGGRLEQVTNKGRKTTMKVIGPPGTEHKDIFDVANVHSMKDYESHDGGMTFEKKWVYPESMDSKRLAVVYGDEGGTAKDGLVEIRRGVQDLDLGGSHYSQVRILVDGTHYIKGMAVYGDDKDFPPGIDIRFHTNKPSGTPVIGADKNNSVLKKISDDPANPFGSLIKEGVNDPDIHTTGGGQSYYYDKDGNKKLSLINKRADEGDWSEWSHKLPSQFLAKQNKHLIEKQLNLAKADSDSEYMDILAMTNPTIKKAMLSKFAEECDSAAVHLKAAALPRERYQVILPLKDIKDNEIYAPNFRNGETVALVRYPHGGTFEIPILKVNNNNAEGKKYITNSAADGVGINSKVAARLSGADFDGDTVMVIPCNSSTSKVRINSKPGLKGVEDFDPKLIYGGKPEGTYKRMTKTNTQNEMGKVSNLIMDMTIKKATDEELARAVRHSMVVIDAEKHGLDYKQSEIDHDIKGLKRKYQLIVDDDGKERTPASTLITRAKAQTSVPKVIGSPKIDPDTGELIFKRAQPEINPKTGKEFTRMQRSNQMSDTKDARTLSTGTVQEELYADYANHMKALANSARKEMVHTKDSGYSPSAAKTYANEVSSLNRKLNAALLNAPRERQAQRLATTTMDNFKESFPDATNKEIKKKSQQALTAARTKVGARREPINISDKEWEAIQAGAITHTKLNKIIKNADEDRLRELATPKGYSNTISSSKVSQIKAMSNSGYTNQEIAERFGVSAATISKYLRTS